MLCVRPQQGAETFKPFGVQLDLQENFYCLPGASCGGDAYIKQELAFPRDFS